MTPTEDAPQDYDKARIAFKDQVRSALASVEDPAERKQFEAEYAELDDDDDFWRFQSRSLVTYATPDRLVTFRLPPTVCRRSKRSAIGSISSHCSVR